MKTRFLLLCAWVFLTVTAPALAADQGNVLQFYQSYLVLVSANDFVTLSRDEPEVWEAKFDGIAKDAGFEDAAAALAAGEDMSDGAVAALRQAVAQKIVQQYEPYRE